jgi:hypothetical protein
MIQFFSPFRSVMKLLVTSPKGFNAQTSSLSFLFDQDPQVADLKRALASRYSVNDFPFDIFMGNHETPQPDDTLLSQGAPVIYAVKGSSRTLNLFIRDWGNYWLTFPFPLTLTVREVRHFVSEHLIQAMEDIDLQMSNRRLEDYELVDRIRGAIEVRATQPFPLVIEFDLELTVNSCLPLKLWFRQDALVAELASRFGRMNRAESFLMKFTSEGKVVAHETPIESIQGKRLCLKQVENAATFCICCPQPKIFRHKFETFPSFTNCLPSLKATHKLEDSCKFRLAFDGKDIGLDDNLAMLESSDDDTITIVQVQEIQYEALGRQSQLGVALTATIRHFVNELRRGTTLVEIRSADHPNKTLGMNQKTSEFVGKVLLVFYDGQPWHFEVLVAGGRRIKPDIREMGTVGESKAAFLTRYRRELDLTNQTPSSCVFCSRIAIFADDEPITAINKEACFVCVETLYDCKVQLPGRLWHDKFVGTSTCGQVRQKLLESGTVTVKSFALTLNKERLDDNLLLAPLFQKDGPVFGIESSEVAAAGGSSGPTIHVTFILPPNDVAEVMSIGGNCTVAQAVGLSRRYFSADPDKVYGVRLSDDIDDDFLDPDSRVIDVEEPRDFFVAEAIAILDDIGKRMVHVDATGLRTVGEVAESLQAGSVIVDRRGVVVDPSLRMSWDAVKGIFPLRLIESGLERQVTVTYLDGTKHRHRVSSLSQVVSLREFVGELMGSPPTSFVFSDVSDDLFISDAPTELVCSAPVAKPRKRDRPGPAAAYMLAPRPDVEPVLPDHRSHRFYRGLDEGRSSRVPDALATPLSDWSKRFLVDGLPTFQKGSHTVLTLCEDPSKKKTICVKTFDEEFRDNPEQRTLFINEVEILWNLKHPCVVPLAGFGLVARRSAGQIGTVFAARGSLGSVIRGRNVLSGTEIGIVVSGIVIGMRFVHSRGVIHRRLNLENILLDDVGHIRITGFEWSRFTDVDPIGAEPPVSNLTAPEIYEGGKPTSAVDVFAFGLILYELIVGAPVFAATQPPDEVRAKVVGGERAKIPESVNETVRKVIKRSWSYDADVRPSFEEILFAFDQIKFRLVANVDVDQVYEFISAVMAESLI